MSQVSQFLDTLEFDQWMDRSFGDTRSVKTWLASGHCALKVPINQRCSRYVPSHRVAALAAFLLPFASGYFAWRRSEGNVGWTALGVASAFVVMEAARR